MESKPTKKALEDFLTFNDSETPEKMEEVARKELGETEELKEECLQEMKALVEEHNVTCITKDDYLLRFLRTKKFSVQRAFKGLQNYAYQRAAFHERLMKFRPEALELCLRNNFVGFLPYRDAEERLVFFLRGDGWNTSFCTDEEFAMTIIVLMNYAAENESSQVTGILIVWDARNPQLANVPHLLRHTSFAKAFLFDSLPVRYCGIHIISQNIVVDYVLRLLRPILPSKIKNRIFLHGSTRDAFFLQIPPCIVPENHGGTLGPLSSDHLVDLILNYLQKLKDEQQYFLPNNR